MKSYKNKIKSYEKHIRHSASCEGVFSSNVALTGFFSVQLRDPRTPVSITLASPFFFVFFWCCFPSHFFEGLVANMAST